MSALDDLLGEFEKNVGTMPQVNPPECAQVLATQTAPEVAGEPEPVVADVAPPAPTEKPAEVVQAEQARTRKPRASKAAQAPATTPAAAPAGWAPSAAFADSPAQLQGLGGDLLGFVDAIGAVQKVLPPGVTLTLTLVGRG